MSDYLLMIKPSVLAVMSCLADRATEGVLQFAKSADPEGERTLGVLTKSDLVKEKAVFKTINDLVEGSTLKLGYFVVRNRGADEDDLDIAQCREKEDALFDNPDWAKIKEKGRTGVQALKDELQSLLLDLAKRELPKQRTEVVKRLAETRQSLSSMGPARHDASSQRECLVKLTGKFEHTVRDALEGLYEGNPLFTQFPELRLITKVVDLNEGFSDLMAKKGHTYEFVVTADSSEPECSSKYERAGPYENALAESFAAGSDFPELDVLTLAELQCPAPSGGVILRRIEASYRETRGPELGTVSLFLFFASFLCACHSFIWTTPFYGIPVPPASVLFNLLELFIKALQTSRYLILKTKKCGYQGLVLHLYCPIYRTNVY